ncbi:MAG: lysophospholipid acyltransferase family protein [Tranquillimonas sp.]
MSAAWHSDTPPDAQAPRGAALLRAVAKGAAIAAVTFGGLTLLLLVRLVERPLFGMSRPVTPRITRTVCRAVLAIMGLRVVRHGVPMRGPGAVVANHSSWLDIFVLNAGDRVYFVSKSEVRDWPGIGWLARATGTVFIRRDRREAAAQRDLLSERLRLGHRLLFFPEGTSTDGSRVLSFKPTLFQAFLDQDPAIGMRVQPVSLRYVAPAGADARFYGWWGDMEFGPHLLRVLAAPRHGRVEVIYHPPVAVADHPGRKPLAAACEDRVRAGFGR